MTEIRRSISAVFRYYPDERGDIRMIYNGHAKIEIDTTVEALWFEINNQRSLHAIYSALLQRIGLPHSDVSATLLADILFEFQSARFIERRGTFTSCLACGADHDLSGNEGQVARFSKCPSCDDEIGLLAWWKQPELTDSVT